MPYSSVSYAGNGSAKSFAVPFPYISKDHVTVTVDGASAPFTWFNASTITVTTTPPSLSVVKIKRTTPISSPLADFNDASTLTESALDLATTQNLYVAQEGDDKAEAIKAEAVAAAIEAAGSVSRAVPAATGSDVNKPLLARAGNTYGWGGNLLLDADPTVNLGAATKQYVDNNLLWRPLFSTVFITPQAGVTFTIPTGYTRFLVVFQDMVPSADGALFFRAAQDGGGYAAGTNDYGSVLSETRDGNNYAGILSGSYASMTGGVRAGFSVLGELEFQADSSKRWTADATYTHSAGSTARGMAGGSVYASGSRITSIFLGFVGANTNSGRVRLFGMT